MLCILFYVSDFNDNLYKYIIPELIFPNLGGFNVYQNLPHSSVYYYVVLESGR